MFSRPAMHTAGRRFFTVTTLDNGFVVATRKNNLPVAKVTLAYGAGSRHEKPEALGVSHMLRSLAFQNTQERSAVRISRESEARGTKLSATTTREMVAYTANCLTAEIPTSLGYIADAMRSAKNETYELNDQRARMALEKASASANPMSVIFEDLHSISFHMGLGNSVHSPDYRIGKVSKKDLDEFVADRYLSSPRCLVAHGVEHEQAVEFAKASFGSLAAPSLAATEAQNLYMGGFSKHTATSGDHTYGVIGFNAVKASDPAASAVRVLEAIVDGTPAVKYGTSLSPVFGPANAEGEAFASLYSDAGIMGVAVHSEAADFGASLKAVASQLQSLAGGSITDQHLQQGKAAAKLQILLVNESAQAVEDTAEELIMNQGALPSVAERLAAIDAVTLPELKAIAKQVLGSKRNLVTYGNPLTVPSLHDL